MSSVPGRYVDNSVDSSKPSTMSSASINTMRPQGYRGMGTMSRPYNGSVPDHYASSRFDTQSPLSEAPRAQRLPPPQSLMTRIPYESPSLSSHPQDQYNFKSTHTQYDNSGLSTSHQTSPFPSSLSPTHNHIYSTAKTHQPYRASSTSDLAPLTHPSQPVSAREAESLSERHLPRISQDINMEAMPPQPTTSNPYQQHPDARFTPDALGINQHAPAPNLAVNLGQTLSAPPLSQAHRIESGPIATRIPNLLAASRAEALNHMDFKLRMRQQPNAARACGFGDRDRRVIDPPPIVELVVKASSLTPEEIRIYLRYESYVMSCAIYDESGTRDSSYMPEEYQHQRRLMGSLVSTPFVGQDENGQEGCFFCFSDLSCRTPGTFRLKFTLMMIDPSQAGKVKHFPILADIKSEAFKVYSAKEFPGMVASSSLAKRLKEQGCIISIKKGNDRTKNSRGPDELSEHDEDDEGETSQGQRKRRAIGN